MKRTIFVGIDLGDKKSVARIATERGSSERMSFVNTRSGRARLLRDLKRRSQDGGAEATIVMAYEASSCGFILHDQAQEEGLVCHVLAPTKMEKSAEQKKHKNDDRDAEDVLEKLRGHVLAGNRLPTVWIPDVETRDDREIVRARLELGEKQTQVKTQIQMLLKRHGLEKPTDLSSGTLAYRSWLKAMSVSERLRWGTRESLGSLLRQLEAIESEMKQLDSRVQQLAQQERHKPIVEALTEEKGVGLLTAMVFRTEIGQACRFRRGRHVGKYAGLTPTSHESGEQSDHKGHISRQGPPRLRKVLCQASWVHIRHDSESRQFYHRLVARNPKKKKIALVAVMRRLAVRLWHRMRQVELLLAR